jgi:hypothetical protein
MKRSKPNVRYNSGIRSRDSAVDIVSTLLARRRKIAVGFPAKAKDFFLLQSFHKGSSAHSMACSADNGGSFLEVKRRGAKADLSPPSSVKVTNLGAIRHAPSCLYGMRVNKYLRHSPNIVLLRS